MIATQDLTNRPPIAFCSSPYEGLQIIREHRKSGTPMPAALMIAGPLTGRLLANMAAKIEKLTGSQKCPSLIVIP